MKNQFMSPGLRRFFFFVLSLMHLDRNSKHRLFLERNTNFVMDTFQFQSYAARQLKGFFGRACEAIGNLN